MHGKLKFIEENLFLFPYNEHEKRGPWATSLLNETIGIIKLA